MAQPDSEDIKSEKRQLDLIRRERDSIQRLLNQARLANLNQEVENLIQEFDRLDAVLSEDDSYWAIIGSFVWKIVFSCELDDWMKLAFSDFEIKERNLCKGSPLSQSKYGVPFLVNGNSGTVLASNLSFPVSPSIFTRNILQLSPLTPFSLYA